MSNDIEVVQPSTNTEASERGSITMMNSPTTTKDFRPWRTSSGRHSVPDRSQKPRSQELKPLVGQRTDDDLSGDDDVFYGIPEQVDNEGLFAVVNHGVRSPVRSQSCRHQAREGRVFSASRMTSMSEYTVHHSRISSTPIFAISKCFG